MRVGASAAARLGRLQPRQEEGTGVAIRTMEAFAARREPRESPHDFVECPWSADSAAASSSSEGCQERKVRWAALDAIEQQLDERVGCEAAAAAALAVAVSEAAALAASKAERAAEVAAKAAAVAAAFATPTSRAVTAPEHTSAVRAASAAVAASKETVTAARAAAVAAASSAVAEASSEFTSIASVEPRPPTSRSLGSMPVPQIPPRVAPNEPAAALAVVPAAVHAQGPTASTHEMKPPNAPPIPLATVSNAAVPVPMDTPADRNIATVKACAQEARKKAVELARSSQPKDEALTPPQHDLWSCGLSVDLGSSFLRLATWGGSEVRAHTQLQMPAYVAITTSGKVLLGHEAKSAAQQRPGNAFQVGTLLRRLHARPEEGESLCEPRPACVTVSCIQGEPREFFVAELLALLLYRARELAQEQVQLPGNLEALVLSVPAQCGLVQRWSLEEAALVAGFSRVRLLRAPVGAALWCYMPAPVEDGIPASTTDSTAQRPRYMNCEKSRGLNTGGMLSRQMQEEWHVLLIDIGARFLDCALVVVECGVFEIRWTGGCACGGSDVDELLAQLCVERAGSDFDDLSIVDAGAWQRLLTACEKTKRTLSGSKSARVHLPQLVKKADLDVTVTVDDLEQLVGTHLVPRLSSCVHEIVDRNDRRFVSRYTWASRTSRGDHKPIDEIVLLGGALKMPCLQKALRDAAGAVCAALHVTPPVSLYDFGRHGTAVAADVAHVIARGAALQGAILGERRDGPCTPVHGMMLIDSCFYAIGLGLGLEKGEEMVRLAVPSHSPIPMRREVCLRIRLRDGEDQGAVIHFHEESNVVGGASTWLGAFILPVPQHHHRQMQRSEPEEDNDQEGLPLSSAAASAGGAAGEENGKHLPTLVYIGKDRETKGSKRSVRLRVKLEVEMDQEGHLQVEVPEVRVSDSEDDAPIGHQEVKDDEEGERQEEKPHGVAILPYRFERRDRLELAPATLAVVADELRASAEEGWTRYGMRPTPAQLEAEPAYVSPRLPNWPPAEMLREEESEEDEPSAAGEAGSSTTNANAASAAATDSNDANDTNARQPPAAGVDTRGAATRARLQKKMQERQRLRAMANPKEDRLASGNDGSCGPETSTASGSAEKSGLSTTEVCAVCLCTEAELGKAFPWVLEKCGHKCICKLCLRKMKSRQKRAQIECPLCRVVSRPVLCERYNGDIYVAEDEIKRVSDPGQNARASSAAAMFEEMYYL
eukprot:TRINITY_DN8987_c0_g1_i1.p1 TRINITY_DN8987_c0_g1~~TRINITY_DN8987_c0_g1_i1.p1  ORF type:complete len:1224 (+),score=271.49 TRINITY_DN8987_c0_g1_i1:66-3737(+)